MAILAKKSSGNFELIPEGTYQGVVFAVYDGGLQKELFNGEEKKVHKIRLGIELNELYLTGQYAGSRITRYPEYTLSLSPKGKLLPIVESVIGRALTEDESTNGYDLEKLIGMNCQVTILHKTSNKGNVYADTTIGALMKGIEKIKPVLQPDYIPEFVQKWINEGEAGETLGDSAGTAEPKEKNKFTLLNEILAKVKTDSALKAEWQTEFMKYGLTAQNISDAQMIELYSKFVLGW